MKGVEPKEVELEEKYMRGVIRRAKKAGKLGEVPMGCVIVYQSGIVGRSYNRRVIDKNILSHTEIIAIEKAHKMMGDWQLEDCAMYVTLEPCPTCAGAVIQARIPRVVTSCMNPRAGCAGSVLDMLHGDGFNHQMETSIGMMEEEYFIMLKEFFEELRRSKS